MKKEQFGELILQVENQSSTIKYDFEIADAFRKLLEDYKDDFVADQAQKLNWEYLLFRLMTKNHFSSDGLRTERFKPMATFNDGSIFPNPNSFPDVALDYFESRTKTCKNPILKARYLDFLWEKSKSKKKHLFAAEAIEQYILTLDAYENEDAIIERLDGLQRATELSLILEGKQAQKPLTKKVVSKLTEQIDNIAKNNNYRWLLEMFELVLALSDFYSQDQVKRFVALCEKAEGYYHSDQNFHLQRSFLKLKAGFMKLLTSPNAKKENDEEIGQSYIDEAEAKSGSGLVKVHFLQEAIKHYSKLGNKKKVDALIAEVKAATAHAIENKEFKQFSSTIELKKDDAERIKASLGTGKEVPEKIGTLPTFLPNWEYAIKMTEEHSKQFVFMHFAKKVTYSEKYPISSPQTPEEEYEDHVMDNYKIQVELAHYWLTGCLKELIKEKKVSLDDFKKFFSKLQIVDNDTYATILEGLNSYFKEDYFHAVYILTPQLEDFLRQLLSMLGGQTTTQHIQANAFTEKNLNRILQELRQYIPEQIFRYISWVMDDYRGYNLRYKIGHGFFKKKHANSMYPTAVLHIFCLLIANTKISVKEKK